jgi:hypothetical protein
MVRIGLIFPAGEHGPAHVTDPDRRPVNLAIHYIEVFAYTCMAFSSTASIINKRRING